MVYAAVAVVFTLSEIQADQLEEAAYSAIKHVLIADGYSETQAKCMVEVLQLQGTTKDVTDIRNAFNPEATLKKVKDKMDFSIFFCKNMALIGYLILLGFGISCCCCIFFCCRSKQRVLKVPNTIQLRVPLYSNGVHTYPYEHMDKV